MTRRDQHRKARRIAFVLAATAGLSVAAIGPGRTVGATCAGHLAAIGDDASYQRGPVTINHSTSATPVVIIGSEGDDTLTGGTAGDIICGRGGNDHIYGLGGADELYGDIGSDVIVGGSGADKLVAGWGLLDHIDAVDLPSPPGLADVIDVGFGFKECVLDIADVAFACTPILPGVPTIGLNPFPLPLP